MKAASGLGERVILVSEANRRIGSAEKHAAHHDALLHRAFSIFLLDDRGRIVLQRRQPGKYHSAGLWANTCCGHPRPGERTGAAARRRLFEEMGVEAELHLAFRTRYCIRVSPDMTENELVYVYFGRMQGRPDPNPDEIDDLAALALPELERGVAEEPERWAVWLRHYLAAHRAEMRAAVEAMAPLPA